MTNNLENRLLFHYKNRGAANSYASKYSCFYLVWYESFSNAYDAIQSEKYIKGKTRRWKENLINEFNTEWRFMNEEIFGYWPPKQEFLNSING